jgi:hypothetical protein
MTLFKRSIVQETIYTLNTLLNCTFLSQNPN